MKYDIGERVKFNSVVQSARWDEGSGTRETTIRNIQTYQVVTHRSKVVVSAVGALSISKECDIPGASDFQGRMFHTANWDHIFNWKNNDIVVIGTYPLTPIRDFTNISPGNGCSATQVLPVISTENNAVRRVTQFARQPHWLSERPNSTYSLSFKLIMLWVPFAMRVYRAWLYYQKERDFAGCNVITGLNMRRKWTEETTEYIRKTAPDKYIDFLVPKIGIGCNRAVSDTDYLACLHRYNVRLVYEDPIETIEGKGARTESGRLVVTDAIILAYGFKIPTPLFPMKIY